MDILQKLVSKTEELGRKEVAEKLDVPEGLLAQFVSGKRAPGLKTCQKVLDLWGNGHSKEIDQELQDGAFTEVTIDPAGEINMSYTPPEWGKKKAAWQGRDVCLCIPTYKPIPGETMFSFMALAMKYKMGMRLEHRGRDSMISRSRNHLAKRFLNSGASWSIWLDSDMVFPFGNAGAFVTLTNMRNLPENLAGCHTVERLISRGKTVVGGCYWDRNGSGKLIAGGGGALLTPIPSDRLHPIGFVGTGCLAVHRQVYLDIAAKFPETMSPDSMGNECGFFTPIQTAARMLGEDESFAKRATDSGHPSYLDLGLILGHIGETIHGIPAKGSKI